MSLNHSFDAAEAAVLAKISALGGEMMPLRWCFFKYLSADLYATGPLPPFSLVTVDGFAVSSRELAQANPYKPVKLEIIETVTSGQQQSKKLLEGTCCYVESGAQTPRGADSVVEAGLVKRTLEFAEFTDSVKPGEGVQIEGSVVKQGDLVMRKGDYLTPARVGILAALGNSEAAVCRPPVIGIISTGNELVEYDNQKPKPGQLRDCNTQMLAAKLTEMRLPNMVLGVVPDSRNALVEEIMQVIHQVDGLIVTGGKVKGRRQFLEETVQTSGEFIVSGVDMTPGGSFSFGLFEGKPVFALPGSPADALLTFDLLVKPAIQKMMGARDFKQLPRQGILSAPLEMECSCDSFIWARFEMGGDSTFHVTPLTGGVKSTIADTIRASCAIRLTAGVHKMSPGDPVSFIATSPDRLLTPPMYVPGAENSGANGQGNSR